MSMDNRAMAYAVLAVAVGYLLISAVPEQVALYTAPRMLMGGPEASPGDEPVLTAGEEVSQPESGELLGEPSPMLDSRKLGAENILELSKWWALDIGLAFAVYWVARRRIG